MAITPFQTPNHSTPSKKSSSNLHFSFKANPYRNVATHLWHDYIMTLPLVLNLPLKTNQKMSKPKQIGSQHFSFFFFLISKAIILKAPRKVPKVYTMYTTPKKEGINKKQHPQFTYNPTNLWSKKWAKN